MTQVGVRELKANLSRYLKRVQAGGRLQVTERGRAIATIVPVNPEVDLEWLHRLVAEGKVNWKGGKPTGSKHPVKLRGKGKTASQIIIEDRG